MQSERSMSQLICDAEELLSKLGDSATPEIRQLRNKVQASMDDMKSAMADSAKTGMDQLLEMTTSVVDHVRANPWVAVAAGTTIAVALIYAAFSRSADSDR